jgi:hypothetical protein
MKRKRSLTIFACFAFMAQGIYAQDTIVKRIDGEDILAKILEVSTEHVKYKRFDNLSGPNYSISSQNVFMIKYEDGSRKVFDKNTSSGKITIRHIAAETEEAAPPVQNTTETVPAASGQQPVQVKQANNGVFEMLGFDGKSVSFRAMIETPFSTVSLNSGERSIKASSISNTRGNIVFGGGATARQGSSLMLPGGATGMRLQKDTEARCEFENVPAGFAPKTIVFLTDDSSAPMTYELASGIWIKLKQISASDESRGAKGSEYETPKPASEPVQTYIPPEPAPEPERKPDVPPEPAAEPETVPDVPPEPAEGDLVNIKYENKTHTVHIGKIGRNDKGNITVELLGEGIGSVLPFKNSMVIVPVAMEILSGGETVKYESCSIGGNSFLFRFPTSVTPAQITIYGNDGTNSSTATFDAITKKLVEGAGNAEPPSDDSAELPEGEENLQPDGNSALLHFYRPKSMVGAAISYNVKMDDEQLFRAKNSSRQTVRVTRSGLQTIRAKTESKSEIRIDIEPGKEYYIRCDMKMGAFVGRPSIKLMDNITGKAEYDAVQLKEKKK